MSSNFIPISARSFLFNSSCYTELSSVHVRVPVPVSVHCRPLVNVRAESRLMDIGASRCILFCASVCGKAGVDGTLRVV